MFKILAILIMVLSLNLFAQTFSSGPTQVPLIELYTSEGCSSCPPADAWLTKLGQSSDLWDKFVPVAFHVDYWNYLGWQDPFSRKQNSDRQRIYHRQGVTQGVYSPGFLYAGREWRTWRAYNELPKLKWPEVGNLTVTLQDQVAYIEFEPAEKSAPEMRATVALLGFNMTNSITRGENKGRRLAHDFVNLAQTERDTQFYENRYVWTIPIPKDLIASSSELGIAIWVSEKESQKPVQSTGGMIE